MQKGRHLIATLGRHKDGITTLLAVLAFLIGGFSYLEFLKDRRIDKALELLKRREAPIFVDARTISIRKWIDNPELRDELANTKVHTPDLIKKVGEAISKDKDYRIALYNLSTLYNHAASCALDHICDALTMCGSLFGEIQEYLDINEAYFVYATKLRQEDAKSLTLNLPEFENFCKQRIKVRYFPRFDRSWKCRIDVNTERLFGFYILGACQNIESEWDQKINRAANELVL